jgi:hypothetical protein
MEIGPNKWKSIQTNGNWTEQMEIGPNQWISVRTNGNRSEQMEIGPNQWKSVRTNGNRTKQMEIGPNKWKSDRTNGNRTEQTEIGPNKKWNAQRKNGNRSELMEIDPNNIDDVVGREIHNPSNLLEQRSRACMQETLLLTISVIWQLSGSNGRYQLLSTCSTHATTGWYQVPQSYTKTPRSGPHLVS